MMDSILSIINEYYNDDISTRMEIQIRQVLLDIIHDDCLCSGLTRAELLEFTHPIIDILKLHQAHKKIILQEDVIQLLPCIVGGYGNSFIRRLLLRGYVRHERRSPRLIHNLLGQPVKDVIERVSGIKCAADFFRATPVLCPESDTTCSICMESCLSESYDTVRLGCTGKHILHWLCYTRLVYNTCLKVEYSSQTLTHVKCPLCREIVYDLDGSSAYQLLFS